MPSVASACPCGATIEQPPTGRRRRFCLGCRPRGRALNEPLGLCACGAPLKRSGDRACSAKCAYAARKCSLCGGHAATDGGICRDCRSAAASIVGDPNHGNKRGYRINGCRCEVCREWKNAQMRAYAARVKARDGVSPTQKARPAKPKSCIRCGESIKGRGPSSYCNPCGHEVRKRSQKGNWITKDRRRALYERDNWTCQLCGEPVDPSTYGARYPTLDHIEPQSLALIPDHSDRNLRTAHLSCNAKRGNRTA